MKRFAIILSTLLFPVTALPEEHSYRVEHAIRSKFPAEERTFTVTLPASYHNAEHRYPVVVLLDGESNLDYSQAVSTFLSENGLIPEVIVVALHAGPARVRDYLPPNPKGAQPSGKAGQFLNYIERELLPFVEKRYRTAPLKVLSGHSAGGLFALYALIEKPGLFHGHIAQSPYLAGAAAASLLQRMDDFLSTNPKLGGFLYMNLGEEPNLIGSYRKLKEILQAKAPEGFRWQAEEMAGNTHMTTRLVGHYSGLEQLFAPDWVLSQEQIVTGKAAGVKKHIEGLSKKFGYPVLYSEQALAQATQILLQQRDPVSSTEMAQLYTEQFPRSPVAFFLLTSAYGSSGKREQAAKAIATAIRLYEADPQPKLRTLYAQMQQIQQRLASK